MRSSRKFEGVNTPWRPEPEISASDAERHVREIDLLPAIAASVPLPIPLPLLHGTFGDPSWPFLCFRFLPGTELVHARLIDRTTVAAPVVPAKNSPASWQTPPSRRF